MNSIMAAPSPVGILPDARGTSPAAYANANHNRDIALQKYMLLHEQHESLRQHLDELRPLQTSFASTAVHTPAASPTRTSSTSSFSSASPTSPYHSRSSSSYGSRRASLPPRAAYGLDTVLDETTLAELAVEEAKLCDVNEGIKRTLTELLNCENVRSDRAFRTWVQCRLMDTERELRSGRRRRSAPEP